MIPFDSSDTIKTDNTERSGFDKNILILLTLFTVLALIMVLHNDLTIKSDGPNYFAYLHSAVFDRDIDFHNEFAHFDKAFWDTYNPKTTITGHFTNLFSVGPAILWSPFYITAHILVTIFNYFGARIVADGYSFPYVLAISLSSLAYSCAGTILIYKACSRYFNRYISLAATMTVFLSTFILYYAIYQPYMSHAVSFFSVTLFIYLWDATRYTRSQRAWAILGLSAGLMMLTRWQNGLFMVLPALESLVEYYHCLFQNQYQQALRLLKNNLFFILFTIIAFLPQLITWKIIYGGFLTIPQGAGFIRWGTPFFTEVLFSSRHGLFSWSPITYVAAAGWVFLFKRDRFMAVSGVICFVLMTYINSTVSDWWAGWGFGMRRFDGLILFLSLGTASLYSALINFKTKYMCILIAVVTLFFVSYNIFLMSSLDKSIHPGGPVDFGKLLYIDHSKIYRYTGYPFSFPANLIFAVQYNLSPARYDTLIGGYIDDPMFYGRTIQMEQDSPLLGSGWSGTERHGGVICRSFKNNSVLYAPVLTVSNFKMNFGAWQNKEQSKVHVFVNGSEVDIVNLQKGWHEYSMELSRKYLKPGVNKISFMNSNSEPIAVQFIEFIRLEPVPSWK